MKLPRPDTTAALIVALAVVGIVVLALFHIAIPDVLTYVAVGALGAHAGTALNEPNGDATLAAARIGDALASIENLIGSLTRPRSGVGLNRPAPAPVIPAQASAAPSAA